jgi:hypothetical protein
MGEDEIENYIDHRLGKVGWKGNPRFTPEAYAALHRFSDGIPRKINMLVSRVLLYGAIEQRDLIDGAVIDAVLDDMAIDGARPEPAPVERPRATLAFAPDPAPEASLRTVHVPDPVLTARIGALEARVEEQEQALRRVLTLLVDWVEGEDARPQGFVSRHGVA